MTTLTALNFQEKRLFIHIQKCKKIASNTYKCSERPLRSSGCWWVFHRNGQCHHSRNLFSDTPYREIRWESFPHRRRYSPHDWTFAIQCDILFQKIRFSFRLNLKSNQITLFFLPDWTGSWYFAGWLVKIELSWNAGNCVTLPLLKDSTLIASTLIASTRKKVTRRATRWPDMLRPNSEFALDSIMPMHCSFISSIIMWSLTGGHIVQNAAPTKHKTCQKVR